MIRAGILAFGFLLSLASIASALDLVWPTPNPAFAQRAPWETFVQATASGEPTSALFGCVRNSGSRFHEGIDLKPIMERRKGEATDPIYAAMDGVVLHVMSRNGRSSYGRYVVMEHKREGVELYTLYAHLASVADGIEKGRYVKAGEVLGIMGRSATGYSIPRERAHLHFEIGLRLSDQFDRWYKQQEFGSPNYHGNYNGMNLSGFDPLEFYTRHRDGGIKRIDAYIKSLPTAYVLQISAAKIPGIVKRNPALLTRQLPPRDLVGWEIAFTWSGVPKSFTPLTSAQAPEIGATGTVKLVAIDREEIQANSCRDTVRIRNGEAVVRGDVTQAIQLMFDLR